jgi:hypothetical protein
MSFPIQQADATAEPELFPYEWLLSEPVQMAISTTAVGVGLLKAVRVARADNTDESMVSGKTVDFQYVMINIVYQALIKLIAEDVVGQPLTLLSPDVVPTGILDRLRQVVETGRPGSYTEVYQLDGATGRFNQVYLKSGDGVLMLVQDVSYRPLSLNEQRQQSALLRAINTHVPVGQVRAMLVDLLSGQTY